MQQLHIAHVPAQDRLLLRVSGADQIEVRLWITRRFLKVLWPVLLEVINTDPKVAAATDLSSRDAVVSFQHQEAVAQTQFTKEYRPPQQARRPLGDTPLLLIDAKLEKAAADEKQVLLVLTTARGREFKFTVGPRLAHSLCKLISDCLGQADWDLELSVGEGDFSKTSTANRTIN